VSPALEPGPWPSPSSGPTESPTAQPTANPINLGVSGAFIVGTGQPEPIKLLGRRLGLGLGLGVFLLLLVLLLVRRMWPMITTPAVNRERTISTTPTQSIIMTVSDKEAAEFLSSQRNICNRSLDSQRVEEAKPNFQSIGNRQSRQGQDEKDEQERKPEKLELTRHPTFILNAITPPKTQQKVKDSPHSGIRVPGAFGSPIRVPKVLPRVTVRVDHRRTKLVEADEADMRRRSVQGTLAAITPSGHAQLPAMFQAHINVKDE
jgi:hypothetical protein